MARSIVRACLQQHRDNLELWQSGHLTPTEPDPDEREAVMRELKTAIHEPEWVLEQIS